MSVSNFGLKLLSNFLLIVSLFLITILAYKHRKIGPIYYEYGSLIITYDNVDIAVKAFYMLREASYDDKNLLVLLLSNILNAAIYVMNNYFGIVIDADLCFHNAREENPDKFNSRIHNKGVYVKMG
uniref:Uncharacterized protein n=1 Tax=Tetranychus urticae TaxID=32264 RepID=T1JU41_TETUR